MSSPILNLRHKTGEFFGRIFFGFVSVPKTFGPTTGDTNGNSKELKPVITFCVEVGFVSFPLHNVYLPNFPMGGVAIHRSRVNNLSPFSRPPSSSKVSQTDCYLKQKVAGSSKSSIVKKSFCNMMEVS